MQPGPAASATIRLYVMLELCLGLDKFITSAASCFQNLNASRPDPGSSQASLLQNTWFAESALLMVVLLILFACADRIAAVLADGLEGPEAGTEPASWSGMSLGGPIIGMVILLAVAPALGNRLQAGYAAYMKPWKREEAFGLSLLMPLVQLAVGIVLLLGARGLTGLWRKAMAMRPTP